MKEERGGRGAEKQRGRQIRQEGEERGSGEQGKEGKEETERRENQQREVVIDPRTGPEVTVRRCFANFKNAVT